MRVHTYVTLHRIVLERGAPVYLIQRCALANRDGACDSRRRARKESREPVSRENARDDGRSHVSDIAGARDPSNALMKWALPTKRTKTCPQKRQFPFIFNRYSQCDWNLILLKFWLPWLHIDERANRALSLYISILSTLLLFYNFNRDSIKYNQI